MVVKIDGNVLYWRDVERGWTTSESFCSKYPRRFEAEAKVLVLASMDPDLIGKLHIKNFYANGPEEYIQEELF